MEKTTDKGEQMMLPKGYKRTEIGILPSDWEVVRLGEVTECLDHKRIPLNESQRAKCEKVFPYYGASGIIDCVDDYLFDEKLVLLGEDGANIIERSARLAFCVEGKIWVNNHAHVLRPKGINQYFLAEILESLKYDKYNTGTAQPKLNQKIVSQILLPLPPLAEQEKIARVLSTWDTQIQNLESLIAEKQTLKKGLCQILLSAKTRLAGFDEPWQVVRLGEVCENFGGKSLEKEVLSSGRYKFISIGNYSTDGRYFDNGQRISLNKHTQEKLLKKDDLVMVLNDKTSDGKIIGSTILIDEDNMYIYNQRSERLICSKRLQPLFAWFVLNSEKIRKKIFKMSQGGTQIYVNFSSVKNIQIPIPPFVEQEKIAEILSEADNEITLLEQKLESLKSQKKGLMQKLLNGKVRTTQCI